jgi:hypothetical protein
VPAGSRRGPARHDTVECTGSARHHEEFTRRAWIYQRLDARLFVHTRFFAAAALTNKVLAELCVHRARWIWISQTTLNTLMTLGGLLEVINLRRADRIESQSGAAGGLDASFVEMEQTYVESVLREWARHCAPRHNRLITELDRLLQTVAKGFLPLQCSPDVRRYEQVLRSVSRTTGRCPSFASCADRISIGNALIEEARRRELLYPSTTSISLLGRAASSNQSSSSSRVWKTSSSISPAPRRS